MSVVPSTIDTLGEQAAALLNLSEAALALTDAGAPERSYVSPSDPAFDCCPFLAVWVAGLTEETTLAGPGGASTGHRTLAGSVILATYQVLAVRCAPSPGGNGSIPAITEIESVAWQVEQDGWSLWNTLRQGIRDGTIFGMCSEVHFDTGVPIAEQGGCVGWRFTIRAAISGIPPEDGS